MVEIEDDDEWSQADDIEDDVDESNSIYAEQIMDRLACALGGKTVLPVAFQHIAQMLQNTDWRHRYAALMTISSIGEGCQPVMGRELGRVIEMVVPYLQDAHPRVRYAACNALGQMSTDFASDLQTKYHAVVVPALIATTQDPHPRVKAHAAAALVNFSEGCDKELLNPYLDSLLSNLYELLRTPRRVVQEQALQTIAVIAESAKDLFAKYYDTFIPVLLLILEQAVGHDQRLMRGKAMECLSLICYVVGPERSRQDALRTMELLAQTPPEQMAADDPQATYVDWACLRLCNTLGADFMPYLAFVMPPLLAKARLKPDLAILDSDDPNAEAAYDAADGWEFVHIHSQKIGINTTALEERSAAVDLLGMYAAKLKVCMPYHPRPSPQTRGCVCLRCSAWPVCSRCTLLVECRAGLHRTCKRSRRSWSRAWGSSSTTACARGRPRRWPRC
jgi:HEAT repeat protein